MLKELNRRAAKTGLAERVDVRQTPSTSLGVTDLLGKVDFVLAFAVVREMPSAAVFFSEVAATMKPGTCVLFAEPAGHVKSERFQAELKAAQQVGLETVEHPSVRHSLTALLKKASYCESTRSGIRANIPSMT
jgi:2-polyprenyl-3-methyl-5-hydroxy-6-metoxy-1,4-benzoquinol methylase